MRLTDTFNGADLRNVCTEAGVLSSSHSNVKHTSYPLIALIAAGLFAIRSDRDYVLEEDFMKAARKIAETKKLEGTLSYEKV